MTDKNRISWYIIVRLAAISLVLAVTYVLNRKYSVVPDDEPYSGVARLIVATYLFSFLSLIALKFNKLRSAIPHVQVVWDILLVTLLILFTGGVSSPYSFLYLLCIVNSCVLLARKGAIYTASLCAILYGALLDLQYYGRLLPFGLSASPALEMGEQRLLYTIFLNILAFYLTAFLTGYLAERNRRSERALVEKGIDYEELDRLNSSIVANLNSGLLTLNHEGRIRVFNQYAESLTGMTQTEAYGRYLHEIFPSICYLGETMNDVQRGEFFFTCFDGTERTIGFKSVPLSDAVGEKTGVIVIFQDLTRLKRMEEELKKADRLSAIGQLAAHIAHEIRNPLASISGSVQLLAQEVAADANNGKLIDIVVRETDRLNKLIHDFLAYARPVKPDLRAMRLSELLSSVELLLRQDVRFAHVSIQVSCDDHVIIEADCDQMEQVFWNLMVNAAEAMEYQGTIKITVKQDAVGSVTISVSDTGCGMDRSEMNRVFEPFFTSKKKGTGLGLATVYRIIEAHGGTITVESSKGKGSVFTVNLPLVLGEAPLEEHIACSHTF
ncbi:nitrogen regulation protein NR(II) [Geobacter sp. DSM 9736]|uniref:two-component system sensor histidine kinase NtrB n=1 Tax=Geobacter sp. DSM 9736 TaxID=1277350 RepID=UPI000B4FF36D|nr:ATP-binding protein [Geobacter sp. DSM 9736]SNB45840.1 two-component system, NtrC family, sensor histidine kinase PilS [Geobacter sp. DSM 9736]